MNDEFKITNIVFSYTSDLTKVIANFSAKFTSGNTLAGQVDLTLDEFNANTEGLVGFSKMIKAKLVADFDNLEAE